MKRFYYKFLYQRISRLLHRFNLHHSRKFGPREDGTYIHRCEWCGMSRPEFPRNFGTMMATKVYEKV